MIDDLYEETVDELIQRWDDGQTINTVEMGGIGPGYEQCIQIMAVEFSRAGRVFKPTGDNEIDTKAWRDLCDDIYKATCNGLGASGAQFGAASSLAYEWCHGKGPYGLREYLKTQGAEDRFILVSKSFP